MRKSHVFQSFFLSLLLPLHAAAQAAPGVNLLVNPGGEDGPGAESYASGAERPPVGWSTTGSFSAARYDIVQPTETLDESDSAAVAGGTNFFWGGNDAVTTASQLVDISALATQIDSGLAATLSAYIGGFFNQNDNLAISATFFDAESNPLGQMQIGPVLPGDRDNETKLSFSKAVQTVPAGARSVEVLMTATRSSGTSNDGYADNLRFVLGNQSLGASNVLTPQTSIEDPPAVTIKGKKGNNVSVVMQKFRKVDLTAAAARLAAARSAKKKRKPITISYTARISLQGSTAKKAVRSKTAKKNVIAFTDLKPGTYTATYSVRAVRGRKVEIQTNISPANTFEVR